MLVFYRFSHMPVKLKECHFECVGLWYLRLTQVFFTVALHSVQQDMEQNLIYKHFEDYRDENHRSLFSENWNQVIYTY